MSASSWGTQLFLAPANPWLGVRHTPTGLWPILELTGCREEISGSWGDKGLQGRLPCLFSSRFSRANLLVLGVEPVLAASRGSAGRWGGGRPRQAHVRPPLLPTSRSHWGPALLGVRGSIAKGWESVRAFDAALSFRRACGRCRHLVCPCAGKGPAPPGPRAPSQPLSDSEDCRTQGVSSPSLEVIKESVPVWGEEAFSGHGNGPPPMTRLLWAHSRPDSESVRAAAPNF